MASDLEASLIDGGITAAAAKVLSNAIQNAATGRLSINRQLEDATPRQSMRLIDRNTRRYILTNLDYPPDTPFRDRVQSQAGRFTPHERPHPYAKSQPASSNPTLSTPAVTGGEYVQAVSGTANEVSQSEVSLRVEDRGGQHARLNQSTGRIESVPISLQIEPKGLIDGDVIEEEGKTVIRLRIVNDALLEFIDWKWGKTTRIETPAGDGILYVNDATVPPWGAQVLIPR